MMMPTVLEPEDVPGELILRVQNCLDAGRSHEIFIGVDNGKWYDLKRALSNNSSSSSLQHSSAGSTSILKYGTFPSINVPLYFNKGHIYSYIVTQTFHSDEYEFLNEESGTTEKPFQKAKQFVDSGTLEDVQDACNDQFYYVKAKCHASYKDVIYLVSIKLNKCSGAVACGICECRQSNLGKCSHVTALLEFIWRHVGEVGYNAGSELLL
ncbi:hypothetical protein Zmor_015377 [Zophobas morio]|uniref:SWIM-type domain-containing protein n=1 Tax=Zophobas morio TaxID=2755281 RepID=A0AA38IHU6_9CUCU|nr:hypothetical protein Zmor_015377 [Zophobas morio]